MSKQQLDQQLFDEWFKSFTSWGLSYDDFIRLSYTPGTDEGDVVFTTDNGHCLTRFMCNRWIETNGSARSGWIAARRAYPSNTLSTEHGQGEGVDND